MRISDWSADVCSSDLFPTSARSGRKITVAHRVSSYNEAVIYPCRRPVWAKAYLTTASMRLIPVGASAGFHQQRHLQFSRTLHAFIDRGDQGIDEILIDLEHQFIVHLHDHQRTLAMRCKPVIEAAHGSLDDYRSEERRVGKECVSTC